MTDPDRDRRIAEWARKEADATDLRLDAQWACQACGKPTTYSDFCPSCWERIAECVEKENRDGTR